MIRRLLQRLWFEITVSVQGLLLMLIVVVPWAWYEDGGGKAFLASWLGW
jgi:hypothetical protein